MNSVKKLGMDYLATMYFVIKLLDLVKVVIFHIWLRKERWLKNLTVPQAA